MFKRKLNSLLIIAWSILNFVACSSGTSQNSSTSLSAESFSKKLNSTSQAQLLDVRTPDEFKKGYLKDAILIDWYDSEFQQKSSLLDKNIPVFVYCLSGGRSSSAASQLRKNGFKEVYELDGGLIKWRAANLPEVKPVAAVTSGMSMQDYENLLNTEQLVLIDFYAPWCAPCRKMKPFLDEISVEMPDKVIIIRINADENQELTKALNVDILPTLILYNNKNLQWSNTGFISKEALIKKLN